MKGMTMATMRWKVAALAVGLMAAACSESTGPEGDPSAAVIPTPQDLTLRIGDEAPVGNSVIRISFGRVVEDSRCPMDVVCVWEGNAVAELGIRAGMGPTFPLQLSTTLEPRSTEWHGVKVTLLELLPYPKASAPTAPGAYTARVRVEQAR